MINFNELQQGAQSCGGYSTAAVLNSLNQNLPPAVGGSVGLAVYNAIQGLQAQAGQAQVPWRIQNPILQQIAGLGQSLPSFIWKYIRNVAPNLNITVHLNNNVLRGNLQNVINNQNVAQAAINEETGRIGNGNVNANAPNVLNMNMIQLDRYYIVLVNQGQHWVVLNKDAQGVHFYDPANQMNIGNLGNAYSGMYIEIF